MIEGMGNRRVSGEEDGRVLDTSNCGCIEVAEREATCSFCPKLTDLL